MEQKPKLGRPPTTGKTPIRSIRVPDDEWDSWTKAAAKLGKSVTQWLRDLAAKAIRSNHKENDQ